MSKKKSKYHGDYSVFKKNKDKKKKNKVVKPKYNKPKKNYRKKHTEKINLEEKENIRLNKYVAHSGLCSRREADNLIAAGEIKVNGNIITDLGTKVNIRDKVEYKGKTLNPEKQRYFLLNKPKDYITTVDDPYAKNTVMDLLKNACDERIYPVGRLDRNTTGVLLFTNDGELTKKLTHPSFNIKKLYKVILSKDVEEEDLQKLRDGITLEDGEIKVDSISYTQSGNKNEIGVEIHSGRNRIVRRMFEHIGYKVVYLDRVVFAGLTKKDVPRGKYRALTEKEIGFLKMK